MAYRGFLLIMAPFGVVKEVWILADKELQKLRDPTILTHLAVEALHALLLSKYPLNEVLGFWNPVIQGLQPQKPCYTKPFGARECRGLGYSHKGMSVNGSRLKCGVR